MSDQLQCPNCGGYKISEEVSAIDATTGKTWTASEIAEDQSTATQAMVWGILLFIITIGIIFLIWAIVLYTKISTGKRVLREGPRTHHYTCHICNFHWEWRDDQPYQPPQVASTHDQDKLLHMGAQRLEEEEEAARRAAAAAYAAEKERLRREREGH